MSDNSLPDWYDADRLMEIFCFIEGIGPPPKEREVIECGDDAEEHF